MSTNKLKITNIIMYYLFMNRGELLPFPPFISATENYYVDIQYRSNC